MLKRKTLPIYSENSISELFQLKLGSYDQWVLIRGENKNNPVVLFLHGGPGTPNIGIAADTQKLLEKHFVVVNWDQIGSGLSFYRNIPQECMSIERMIEYTKELINYLRKRFNKEKIYLVGHSWGSLLGILIAEKYPMMIEKYVGVSQMVGGELNEKIAYEYCYKCALESKNQKALKQLNEIGKPPYINWIKGLQKRSYWSNFFGGAIHKGSLSYEYIKRMLMSKEYRIIDIYRFMSGFTLSLENIWPEIMVFNLKEHVSQLKVESYFFLGRYDFQAPYEIAQEYILSLEAESKEIIWFENSAHMCHIEEIEKFQECLVNILK